MTKKVSIVVPTYNQAKYLPITVDHILQQDYPDIEVIVVNAASPDNTREVIDEYVGKTLREEVSTVDRYDAEPGTVRRRVYARFELKRDMVVKHLDRDPGISEMFNVGLRLAKGEYATYIVSDDIPHPTMISEMVAALERERVDFVYADMNVVDDAGRVLQTMRKPDYSFERCFADWFHLGVARLYKRAWHDKVGLFDPAYRNANDYDMYLRMAMAGCAFYHLPKTLYSVRVHEPYRPTNQHTPERNANLHRESIACALRAREFMSKGGR